MMKFEIGDTVIIRDNNKSIYTFVDTDPRYLKYGKVKNIVNGEYQIECKGEVLHFSCEQGADSPLFSVERYSKYCNGIAAHLTSNAKTAHTL